MHGGVEQGDEADEAFGGTNPRAASGAQPEAPPHAPEVRDCRGHRFAAYPPCWMDSWASTSGQKGSTDTAQGRVKTPGVLPLETGLFVTTAILQRPPRLSRQASCWFHGLPRAAGGWLGSRSRGPDPLGPDFRLGLPWGSSAT